MSQIWLITGCSRGLGRSLAEAVLAAGHQLVATARNSAQLADLVGRYGDRVCPIALDVTDERAAVHAIKAAVNTFGRLDVLVNNAGYGERLSDWQSGIWQDAETFNSSFILHSFAAHPLVRFCPGCKPEGLS